VTETAFLQALASGRGQFQLVTIGEGGPPSGAAVWLRHGDVRTLELAAQTFSDETMRSMKPVVLLVSTCECPIVWVARSLGKVHGALNGEFMQAARAMRMPPGLARRIYKAADDHTECDRRLRAAMCEALGLTDTSARGAAHG
jgi:hypothetical protein